MAVIAAVGGVIMWWYLRHLDAQEDELNELGAGEFHEIKKN
jgi:hypothetical protein